MIYSGLVYQLLEISGDDVAAGCFLVTSGKENFPRDTPSESVILSRKFRITTRRCFMELLTKYLSKEIGEIANTFDWQM